MNKESSPYRQFIDQATASHIAGDYPAAIQHATAAHYELTGREFTTNSIQLRDDITQLSPDNQSEAAANLRNIAARYERLGQSQDPTRQAELNQLAEYLMYDAHYVHQKLLDNTDLNNREEAAKAEREVAADKFYLGAFALKTAMREELRGGSDAPRAETAIIAMRQSQQLLESATEHDGDEHHQYWINGLGRFSLAESLYGNVKDGRRLARQALRQARYSEPDRSAKERAAARVKAGLRALGAYAVAGMVQMDARKPALRTAGKLL